MKKITAIILTVIMLMTVLPLNSFAFFGSKLPEVKNIVFESNDPIYCSLLKEDLEYLEDYAKENEETLEDADYIFDICYQLYDYNITVEFTDGKKLELTEDYYETDDYQITVYAETDIREAISAFEKGEKTVPLKVYAEINNYFKETVSKEFSAQINIQECYFKEIKYISGLPESISENKYWLDLAGCKFEVTYFDGTKKTVEIPLDEESYFYEIDEQTLSCRIDAENSRIVFNCFDAEFFADIDIISYPFSDIVITDFSHSKETGLLENLSYEIIMKDDSTKAFTVDSIEYIFPEDPEEAPYAVVGQIEGFDIIVRTEVEILEVSPSIMIVSDELSIEGADLNDFNTNVYREEINNPIVNFLMKLINSFRKIADFIRSLFS